MKQAKGASENASFGRPSAEALRSGSSGGVDAGAPANWTLALAGVTLTVRAGEVCVVGGPVGCGKSTLLSALLGEVACVHGRCSLEGSRVAYSPQEPWILAGTLRANILFGAPLEVGRLARVLAACCLEPDVAQLPHGLETEIGEKGVNLSGGQKARVSLARACYAKAAVVLLDDPLSAVDRPWPGTCSCTASRAGWRARTAARSCSSRTSASF